MKKRDMIICVASGKGGTGKTTVSTNLARVLNSNAQILDCDVEEPNAHLFIKPSISYTAKAFTNVPKVDEERCNYCGKCADICRFSAIAVLNDAVLTFPQLCHNCGGCMRVCPEDAISEGKRELGEIEKGMADSLEFVHGRMRLGESMAPPLIKKVRRHTNRDNITIIDAPPGTSCPVIAAMKDSDYVLMVTEPTPFGLHDLKLAFEVVEKLGIDSGLVINRSDIGDEGVEEFASRHNIEILMKIPFDRSIAEGYSKGNLLVDQSEKWRNEFQLLFERIESNYQSKRS